MRRTACEAAETLGHPDIGSLVRERVAAGHILARISRDAGLHKDWLCRHLAAVDAAAARHATAAAPRPTPAGCPPSGRSASPTSRPTSTTGTSHGAGRWPRSRARSACGTAPWRRRWTATA